MEPKNRNSQEWREWFVRHRYGATMVELLKNSDTREYEILKDYLHDLTLEKYIIPGKKIKKNK